jgi:hypothetical protein
LASTQNIGNLIVSKTKVVGWVLSVLLAAFLIFASALGKLTEWEGKQDMFAKLGWDTGVMYNIGIVEIGIAVMFLIPRTAFVGTVLLTAYLGGATATHVRVGDPFIAPIVVALVAWIALGLRDGRVFGMAIHCPNCQVACDKDATRST